MENDKKKPIMIGIIVVCLVAAGIIFWLQRPGSSGGIEDIKRGELIWVKCSNPDCGAEYQVDKRDYYEFLQENANPMVMTTPPMECKECGEESVYRAEKCENCGAIFFRGSVPNDFADRCPECGHSKTERLRKEAREKRGE